MEIQRINNSPSFQAIKLSEQECNKVAKIIRAYRKNANPALKEQLLDIFTPHIEKEASSHEGILKQDFIQDLRLCLFDNFEKLGKRKPAEELVNELNKVTTGDCFATMGHKSLEELAETEMEKLVRSEDDFIHELNINDIMFNSKYFIDRANELTGRMKHIMKAKFEGKNNEEIGYELHLTKERVKQIIESTSRALQRDANFRANIGTNKTVFPQEHIPFEDFEAITEYYQRALTRHAQMRVNDVPAEEPILKIKRKAGQNSKTKTREASQSVSASDRAKLEALRIEYFRNPTYQNYASFREEKIRQMSMKNTRKNPEIAYESDKAKLERLSLAYIRDPSYHNYVRLEEEKFRQMRFANCTDL